MACDVKRQHGSPRGFVYIEKGVCREAVAYVGDVMTCENVIICQNRARIGPMLTHRPDSGPVPAHYGMFTGTMQEWSQCHNLHILHTEILVGASSIVINLFLFLLPIIPLTRCVLIHIIPILFNFTGNVNVYLLSSSWITRVCLFHTVNLLLRRGARLSAAMVFHHCYR